jgi:hypothetical protein
MPFKPIYLTETAPGQTITDDRQILSLHSAVTWVEHHVDTKTKGAPTWMNLIAKLSNAVIGHEDISGTRDALHDALVVKGWARKD